MNARLKPNKRVDKCIIGIFFRFNVIFRFCYPETGPFREPLNYLNVKRDKNGNILMYKCILNGILGLESMNCVSITRRDTTAFRRVVYYTLRRAGFLKILFLFFISGSKSENTPRKLFNLFDNISAVVGSKTFF